MRATYRRCTRITVTTVSGTAKNSPAMPKMTPNITIATSVSAGGSATARFCTIGTTRWPSMNCTATYTPTA